MSLQDGDTPKGCFYLVVRPSGGTKSENVDEDNVKKMTDTYGLDFTNFIDNVRKCNNKSPTERDPSIDVGDDRYPACFFGLAYVEGSLDWPITEAGCQNADTVPDWVFGDVADAWSEPRDKICELEKFKDAPACNT